MRVNTLFSKDKKENKLLDKKFKDFVLWYNSKSLKTMISEKYDCKFKNISGNIFIVLGIVITANFIF